MTQPPAPPPAPTPDKGFAEAFADHIHFKPNRFHPLVWINGEPEIGEGVYIGGMSEVNATKVRVRIGDHCDIASFVSINAADSHRLCIGQASAVDRRDIVLEDHVFVGSHSVIKGGAHIGHHSVVAAGTIVEGRTIPPYSLVIGNPMVVKPGYYRPQAEAVADLPAAVPETATAAPVPHNLPTLGPQEEAAAAVVIRSGWVAQGREVQALEDEFCARLGLPSGHAVALASGSAALLVAQHLLGAAGQRVAMPAYACASLAQSCRWAGGQPLFVDNAPGSPNADLAAVRASGAALAVVPHYYGLAQDLAGLRGLRVVEDCAQALGARVHGRAAGLQGELGVFSFYATKLITSGGQGGMLVARDRALADAARAFRQFDQPGDARSRLNLQMTDLQAAVGRVQLRRLDEFLERRAALFEHYRAAGLPLLDSHDPACQPVRFRAVLHTPHAAAVMAALAAVQVKAIVPLGDDELLADPALVPQAAALSRSTVSLPLYPTLAEADARRIARVVAEVLAAAGRA